MRVGLVPCAGLASRMHGIPKFLLPIDSPQKNLLGHWLEIMKSQMDEVKVLTSADFGFLVRKFVPKDVEVILVETSTMNETLNFARNTRDHATYTVCMPDTYIPDDTNAISEIANELEQGNAIAHLSSYIIRADQVGKLGQISFDDSYIVKEIVDKDENCKFEHAWGLVSFKSDFWKYLDSNQPHIGYSIREAIKQGETVSTRLGIGEYYDCGTFSEYRRAISH